MDMQRKVILMLQKFIIERENADKRRKYRRENENLDLSLTQFHIIELIDKNDKINNKFLAKELNLSKPAVTKSIKKLLSKNLVVELNNEENKREIYYKLTKKGEKLSFIHDDLHKKAVKKYEEVLKVFDDKEMETIIEFLQRSVDELKKEEVDSNG
ncbi:MarR family transcriptional regulator [Staphylococcus sp. HMSC068D08]|nr:MarR family transcriptional regulator [Staphylococcus lugdunensis]EVI53037.1 MarR family transcriptional regulator [Staphylococcus lugdunensis UCIM6116]KAK58176.1 MarR family protein [Staphylococcus lugdunensis VCU150]KAK62289.1 MarR family protein [Staphylococcus lugdunensis VCU148]OFM42943.1 MarR family transcriptional regulator [Staphylococcus sp. HMSC068D08]OFN51568.1 MarR family transcriptional regulator [Staphylococcus sp. HMSC062E10]OFN88557.1 MarR family transcriptional regulator [